MKKFLLVFLTFWSCSFFSSAEACTGITLRTASNQPISARTIDWAAEPLNMMYVVVPRGHKHKSLLPDGSKQGMRFQSKYGYVGIAVEDERFIMEGVNEKGLSAGLFYFPDYGEYQSFDTAVNYLTINDMQFVSWILASCSDINQLLKKINQIYIVGIDPRASTVHWRVTEPSGRQVVLEIINQRMVVHENTLGVLTNSPSLPWHLTNLNNYLHLQPGTTPPRDMGELELKSLGIGSGLYGLPGDMTSPSRFVRASFFQSTAPVFAQSEKTVLHAFHILNNFSIPIGLQFSEPDLAPDMHTATQVTIVTDLVNRCFYFRTMYNSTIRCIDLQMIDFDRVSYKVDVLELSLDEPIEYIEVY